MKTTHAKRNRRLATDSESNQRIYGFLSTRSVGVLSTTDPNGDPHATVIYFSIDDEFLVTFMTKRDTKKYDNLRLNNHAMLVAYEPFTQTTAQIIGKAVEINDPAEADKVFRKMSESAERTSDSGIPPISKLSAGSYVAFRLEPLQIRMAMFVRPDPGGYDLFETVDFN